jgi:hypothetical protein
MTVLLLMTGFFHSVNGSAKPELRLDPHIADSMPPGLALTRYLMWINALDMFLAKNRTLQARFGDIGRSRKCTSENDMGLLGTEMFFFDAASHGPFTNGGSTE